MDRDRIDRLLAEFGERLELEGLALDEEGVAQLALDDVLVTLEHDEAGGRLVMTAPLGEPRGDRAEAYGRLLDANLFWSGTDGATLARERASGMVVMMRALPVAGLDPDGFEGALRGFVDAAERIASDLAEPEAAPVTAGGLMMGGYLRG